MVSFVQPSPGGGGVVPAQIPVTSSGMRAAVYGAAGLETVYIHSVIIY